MSRQSNHLDEKTLELYVLDAAAVNEQRGSIRKHLMQCAACADIHRRMKEYYSQLARLESARRNISTQALYMPHRGISVRAAEYPMPHVASQSMPARMMESLRRYPFRWASGFAALVAALVLLIPSLWTADSNPAYARPEKEFMVVYNRHGEELWRRYVFKGFVAEGMPGWISEHPERGCIVRDVDNDGRNEVMGIFGWTASPYMGPNNPLQNVVVCFNADGSERWRYELHRTVTIGGVPYSDDYGFYQILYEEYGDGSADVVAFATHRPWFPNVIVRLDARTGAFKSEYWHNGMLPYYIQKDLDGDGIQELLLGGQNNRLMQASLAVFDPRKVEGHGPAPAGFAPEGIAAGTEKYYLLFPGSDLKKFWSDITNEVTGVKLMEDGLIQVIVAEKVPFPVKMEDPAPNGGTLYFYFDSSMRCVRVRPSDAFSGLHGRYRDRGLVTSELSDEYFENLRRGIRYWDGEKFVQEPVMNRRYRGVAMR
jgi:hypothetical protein